MRYGIVKILYLGLIFLFSSPAIAMAIPAITCHCFTDRVYDPAHPTMADPYFLAATQNSYFAAVFGIEKKTIVIKKQKGASADDLWIAYWLTSKTGRDPEGLLRERNNKESWGQVVTSLTIPTTSMGGNLVAALKANTVDERLAEAIVNELLLQYRIHNEQDLSALRNAGAGNQELILAGLIAAKIRQPAMQLFREIKEGSASWGEMLQRAKISPSEIESEVTNLVMASNR